MAGMISPLAAVAFIGLGKEGVPMATRLAGASFTLRGWDLAPPARAPSMRRSTMGRSTLCRRT